MHRGLDLIRSARLLNSPVLTSPPPTAVSPTSRRRKLHLLPPPMEPGGVASAGSDASSSPEDYVHVSGPDPIELAFAAEEAEPNPSQIAESPDSSSTADAAPAPTAAVEPSGRSGGPGTASSSEEAEPNSIPISDLDPSSCPTEGSARSSAEEASGGSEGPEGGGGSKRPLREELAKGVVFLQCESSAEGGTCDVYLVGTAHVSQESCREVQEVIRCLKPQVVFLELCSSRVSMLTPQNLKVPTVNEMFDLWKKKKMNAFGILYSWFLAKVADQLEVFPGSEFRVAYEEAISYGAKVILGDRPVNITLRRTWGKMSLWHRAKFLYNILFQTLFLPSAEDLNKMLKEMDDVDMVTLVIQEMSKAFPTLMETLLYERDLYMSSTLLKVASEHSSVVAVVGRGHLSGIKQHWKQPFEVKHLLEIPAGNGGLYRMKILTSVGLAATGVAIASAALYLMSKR